MNNFEFSYNNKRYHTLDYHNKTNGIKLYKAVINCGLSCPNADGTKGRGGCIYCSGGSRLFTADSSYSVTGQLDAEACRIRKKVPDALLCAYFQTGTNTYAPTEVLRSFWTEAVSHSLVRSLAIATRPDCISGECYSLLAEINEIMPVTVELGLQTANDKTAELINRCYPYDAFEDCYNRLKSIGIRVCVHIINGLPGESRDDMLFTAKKLSELRPDAVKIHSLYVVRGTHLEQMYLRGEYIPVSFEDYTQTVVSQLELLPPETVIERLTGDGDKRSLVAPEWSKDKIRVLGTIDKIMAEKDTVQGRLFGLY